MKTKKSKLSILSHVIWVVYKSGWHHFVGVKDLKAMAFMMKEFGKSNAVHSYIVMTKDQAIKRKIDENIFFYVQEPTKKNGVKKTKRGKK